MRIQEILSKLIGKEIWLDFRDGVIFIRGAKCPIARGIIRDVQGEIFRFEIFNESGTTIGMELLSIAKVGSIDASLLNVPR